MRWIIFLFLAGCASTPAFEVSTVTPEQFTVTVKTFSVKQDDTLTAVKENTAAIEKIVVKINSLEGAIADTRKTMEASMVVSDPNGKEVIKSEDTSPDKNANVSHPSKQDVAESGDVPLFVSVTRFCLPCNLVKKDFLAGKLEGFDVKFCVQSDSHRNELIAEGIPADRVVVEDINATPFPAIRYKSDQSVTGWKWHTPRGYGPRVLMELRSTLLGEETPIEYPQTFVEPVQSHQDLVAIHNRLHGGGQWMWPGGTVESLRSHLANTHGVQIDGTDANYEANTVVRARSVVSTSARRPLVSWRSRSVLRSNCPGGRCP